MPTTDSKVLSSTTVLLPPRKINLPLHYGFQPKSAAAPSVTSDPYFSARKSHRSCRAEQYGRPYRCEGLPSHPSPLVCAESSGAHEMSRRLLILGSTSEPA